ncbi:STRN4 protein, partial [Copsychus sechellarum]|nr:STRN4 protein [Copsychus sechellarum]
DPGVLRGVLDGHADAVWGLAFDVTGRHLASCSADGTVRLWDPRGDSGGGTGGGTGVSSGVPECPQVSLMSPLSPRWLWPGEPGGHSPLVSPGVPLMSPRCGSGQVNQVVTHPSQPLTITASDDRGIRYLDNRTGHDCSLRLWHLCQRTCVTCVPCLYPQVTTVRCGCGTCVTCVPCLSPGHDCSLRLWHLCQRTCVQELPAHRRKHAEAVLAVAFHPRRSLSASAGADALAKVFV